MSDADADDKTEAATAEKLNNARDEGQFPRSKDAQSVGASLAVLVALITMREEYASVLGEFARRHFGHPYALVNGHLSNVASEVGGMILKLVLVPAALAVCVSIAIGIAEAGWKPMLELAMPKWERIDPTSKLMNMLNPKAQAATAAISVARVGVIGYISYYLLRDAFPHMSRLMRAELSAGVVEVLTVAARFALWATFALFLLAAVDYIHSYYTHHKNMRMTKQEVKEEHIQSEGDPRTKAKQRARARENLRRGLMKEVPTADVVLANPTHISIALRYRAKEGAPVVVAKGYDEIALFIRKIAKDNNIPVIENKPLARALDKNTKKGKAIPVEMYAAVAEVLAFVYRLRNRAIPAPSPRGRPVANRPVARN